MKHVLKFILLISIPLLSLRQKSENSISPPSQTFKIVDSSVFELPFTAYDQPAIIMQMQGDSIYLLNYYGGEFYILDKKGTVYRKIIFSNLLASKYNFSPINFYLSKNYYVFIDGNVHPLLVDKSLKVCGYYWCNSFHDDYYYSVMMSDFFFSETNQTIYYPCKYGTQDTDTLQSLTHEYYSKNIVGAFKLPFIRCDDTSIASKDTNIMQKLLNGKYLIHQSNIYLREKGFLPYLNFRSIVFDEVRNEMIISEAPDSLIRVYDLDGNLLRTFGRKGNYIELRDSLRFIRSFNKNAYPKYAFGFITDSLMYRCAFYAHQKANPDLQLLAREYVVDDSSKIVSGNEVQYRNNQLYSNSVIRRTYYVQLYDHEKLAGEFKVPTKWAFVGFRGKDLVFYKMENIEKTFHYMMYVYYVSQS